MLTAYGDISPAVAASCAVDMLKRGQPYLTIQQFGQSKPLGRNQTDTQKFRRYESLAPATTPVTEGVTPTGSTPTTHTYTAVLQQYLDYLELTDRIEDLHTDPVLKEFSDMLGEQAALTVETVAFGIIKAGTTVYRANGSARTDINTPVTKNLVRKVTRGLKRQLSRKFTRKVSSSTKFNTESVAPSVICLCHSDLEDSISNLPKFKDVVDYGSMTPYESEIGSADGVRYITSTVFEAWEDAGGDYDGSGVEMISTSGTKANVYPMIFLTPDAFGVVPLKGANAITPMVLNPNVPRGGDPGGQRGSIAWKTYFTAVILHQGWMARAEVSAEEL